MNNVNVWPIIKNPFFEKYRNMLGEELFQEFAESTKELASSIFWLHRMTYLTDKECIKFLVKKLENK